MTRAHVGVLRPCARPGCSKLTEQVRCEEHARAEERRLATVREQYDEARGSAGDRGYDHAWKRLRDSYIAAHYFCEEPGCMERATEVDHRIELRDGGARLAWENLQALCHAHHVKKTQRERRRRALM